MTPTDYRVDQLIHDALTDAIRAEVYGVGLYDYAENLLLNLDVSATSEQALRKLSNLRDMYTADEAEWMLERAPLKQGDVRDGVVK